MVFYLCRLDGGRISTSNKPVVMQAAESAEAKKQRKYAFLGDRYIFVPVAIETFGFRGRRPADVLFNSVN